MSGIIPFILAFFLLWIPLPVRAFTITDDPQYIVMNIASVNELDWAVPEEVWQSSVKPNIVSYVREIKSSLPNGTDMRKSAWSTLLEYMNYPMDTPSPESVYVIKARRIMEIAEEENLPVFMPLNGFQWWDELPELYNWWDPDGTHTPQAFFSRQKTKDFRQRFVSGYDPDNRWNVEWSDYRTPMQLNWRNWGGGGFRLAPPPDILKHRRAKRTYRDVLDARFMAIVTQISSVADRWQREGKGYLFAGISLGTEVSLNASVTRSDEFVPYGYRAAQDLVCPVREPECGNTSPLSAERLRYARQDALQSYLFDLSYIAHAKGIPKQRVYTHVYADTYAGNPRFEKYADAAFTPFARPGISLYGSATNPMGLTQWTQALSDQSYPAWGALEYSAGNTYGAWATGLEQTMDNAVQPARILVIYNLREHRGTPAMAALRDFIPAAPARPCILPEILPDTPDGAENPDNLSWRYVPADTAPNVGRVWIHVTSVVTSFSVPIQEKTYPVPDSLTSVAADTVPYGTHDWYVETEGCGGKKQYSEPRTITMKAHFLNIGPVNWIIKTLKRLQ